MQLTTPLVLEKDMENTKLRIWKASLLAPLGVLIIPALISLAVMLMKSTSELDDAPKRASVLFLLIVLPLFYIILFILMSLGSLLLKKLNRLKKPFLFTCAILLALINGVMIGFSSSFGLKDQLIGFVIIGLLTFVCLTLGIMIWWRVAFSHKSKLNQI
jgi:cytochrome bd-type quinol oxidase subunit 2